MKKFCLIPLILCLFLCGPSCKRGQEEKVPKVEKMEEQAPMIEEGEQMMEETVEPEAPALEGGEESKAPMGEESGEPGAPEAEKGEVKE